jgi:hypothetical protein
VEVIGPASAIASLTEAITEPVSVEGASATIVESVNVGVADPSVRLRTPATARVTVTIAPGPAEWAVEQVPVRASDGAALITPDAVTVYVRGPREAGSAGAAGFDATVETSGLRDGVFRLPVRVTPPPRLGVVRVEPPAVQVRVP